MKKAINFVIGLLVTISLLWFLLKQISVTEISSIFRKISIVFVLMAFILYAISFWVRSFKYRILLGDLTVKRLFSIVCIHNMMVSILPARTGELSFVYLVKKEGLRGTKALSTLVISRVFDFISILLLFLFFVLIARDVPITFGIISYLVIFILLMLIALFFVITYFDDFSLRLLRKIVSWLKAEKIRWVSFVMERIEFLIKSFDVVKLHNKFFIILFFSIMTYAIQLLTIYALMAGMKINISFVTAIFALTLFFLFTTIPIQSFVGLGTFEGFWALAFISLGADKTVAISSGFVQHLFFIVFFLILGFYGMARLKLKKKVI